MTPSHLDELIEAERKRAAERIAKLKSAAAAEQRRIDDKVLGLLREQQSDLYRRLSAEAAEALAAEKARRSSRAKRLATPLTEGFDRPLEQTDADTCEESAPWNG